MVSLTERANRRGIGRRAARPHLRSWRLERAAARAGERYSLAARLDDAANATNKLFTRYGSKPGPQPDLAAIQRNMTEYEDQYAAAINFLIRGFAREAVSSKLFMAGFAPEQRTRVREEGLARLRSSAAEFILDAICSVIQSGGKDR
jgi:hypothetical protein